MRHLIGMEMVCFGKSRHFELEYEGGHYVDDRGEPVEDVVDLACYVCTAAFYTREGDFVPFCPNCGHIDRKRFDSKEALVDFVRGHDLSWLKKNGCAAATVQTLEGDWQLRFARDLGALEATGRYKHVHKL